MLRTPQPLREVVLVGGGHAHVQVLEAFAAMPLAGARLTVVVDTPIAVYSGMVPGFVAGQYRAEELEIDVLPLARRAGARCVVARCVGVDAAARRLLLEGRASLPYDVASFDVGSTVLGLDRPGVREHALPTRPIGRFVRRVEERLARLGPAPRVVVVGAGAGGVELAFTLGWRLRAAAPAMTLVQQDDEILPSYPPSLRRKVRAAAARRGIEILTGRQVVRLEDDALTFAGGEAVPCELAVWVAGAAAHSLFVDSGLPTDGSGFVRVRPTLQVEGHDELLAAGDCATLAEHPRTPKAGVYAVRQGPFLAHNLRALLAGGPLRRYVPQGDFLTLLNVGDGTAFGAKWGASFGGAWVMRWKDTIDRRFMRRFQVLDGEGALLPEFRRGRAMSSDGMAGPCGGCAAKVAQPRLARALASLGPATTDPTVMLGLGEADDVAAWRTAGGDRLAASVDLFPAFTDDPFLVGAVAAVNAVSDLYASGAAPRWALAIVVVPEAEGAGGGEETLGQVLAGARRALDPLGVALVGGHSTSGLALAVGFAVHGELPPAGRWLPLAGLRPGQALVLTKALGTGVLLRADMMGRLRAPWFEAAVASMLRPNRDAAAVALEAGATAATDVTGFGLAGHLEGMLRASGVAARLDLGTLPALPGALELLAQGLRSTFHSQNEQATSVLLAPEGAGHPRLPLLFDPQTSGGLLFGVAAERAAAVVADLHRRGAAAAAVIGEVSAAGSEGPRIEASLRAPDGLR
jgi:selenide,water dikinase